MYTYMYIYIYTHTYFPDRASGSRIITIVTKVNPSDKGDNNNDDNNNNSSSSSNNDNSSSGHNNDSSNDSSSSSSSSSHFGPKASFEPSLPAQSFAAAGRQAQKAGG